MAGESQPEREAVGGQLLIPAAGILFTLYYFSTIWDGPFEAQVAAFLVGSILVVLSAFFVLRTLGRWRAGEVSLGMDEIVGHRSIMVRRLGLLGLTLAYVLLIDSLGFTITTFLFLACATMLLGASRRPKVAILFAAAAALLGYLLFILAFETRFPNGPFETMMKGLL